MIKQILFCLIFLSLGYWVCDVNQQTEYACHDNHFLEYQDGVVNHTITGPLAYRVMIPYLIHFCKDIDPGIQEIRIDFCLNIIFVFLTLFVFFYYMKNFLSEMTAFGGSVLMTLVVLMGFASFMGVHVYETTDICNLFFISLALLLLYSKKWNLLLLILFISMFNRETPALLLIPILIITGQEKCSLTYRAMCIIAVAVPYLLLRITIHPPHPDWFLTVFLNENIPFLEHGKIMIVCIAYIKIFLFVGVAGIIALIDFKNKNKFLKTVSFIVPVFIPLHIIVGHVEEYRMWMPVFLFLIPLGMQTIEKKYSSGQNHP